MRSVSLMAALALAALAQTPAVTAPPARVEGHALNANTGAPLKKVTVWLKPSSDGGSVPDAHSGAVRSTVTDAQGRFAFDRVEPGAYVLSGWRNGFLEQGYGARAPIVPGAPFQLESGQNLSDMVLQLTPQGILFGKVTDEDGDPLPNAQVQAVRVGLPGRRQAKEGSAVSTQDDGSFVIGNLTPGRYRVSAVYGSDEEEPVGTGSREAYVPTYYPSTTDSAAAALMEVGPGAEVRGLNVRLARVPVYRVRGRVVDAATGKSAGNASLRLVRAGEDGGVTRGVTVGSDGVFEFRRVLPGDYLIQSANDTSVIVFDHGSGAVLRAAGMLVGRKPLHVGQEDIENLVVALGSGAEVRGSIRFDGAPASPPGGLQLELMPVDGDPVNAVVAPIDRNGVFHFTGVMPDSYTVSVGGLRDSFYVQSVRVGNQDVTHLPLDLTAAAPTTMEILLSPDGGEIAGVVRGPGGDIVPGAAVRVWAGDGTVYPATADARGSFRVGGLEPGEYRIFAWEDPDPALTVDAAMRSAFEGFSVSVKLSERGHETVDLKLISRETVDAELAKAR